MAEVLVDQTTKAFQTNWNNSATRSGQLFLPPAGETWRITEISVYGAGNWVAGECYLAIGVCKTKTYWNPNNGFRLGEYSYLRLTDDGEKHTWDLTSLNGDSHGYSDGWLVDYSNLWWFAIRHVAGAFSGTIHGSTGYAPAGASATIEAFDSNNSGGTWNKPATWVTTPNDLRFEIQGEQVAAAGGAQHNTNPTWSF